jgi:hypothetical protein
MRQLDAWLSRSGETDEVERAVSRYRDAIDEWNDNVNRILALSQRYFGKEVRDYLDYGVMTRFVAAGSTLEARIRDYRTSADQPSPSVSTRLDSLANEVYALNVRLIEAIQRGHSECSIRMSRREQ